MSLVLHTGGKEVEFAELREVPLPEATSRYSPIEHFTVVDMVKYALGYFNHEVVEEHHALAKDGAQYFGLLTLKSPYGTYTDTLGLRNSHDKSFPVGLSFGSRVFVCDNLAFCGDHTVKRRHTPKLKFELPGIISSIVEPLAQKRNEQANMFERYQHTMLDKFQADHAIMQMYRDGVIRSGLIKEVNRQWENPSYDWGDKTAYRLFNATTHVLNGEVAEKPMLTYKLHKVIDGACETV